ncbi:MAG: 1,4-alpha-glucan branching protein GlgB [bacterium]
MSDAELFLSDSDIYLFNEGTHFHLYNKMGAHLATSGGVPGATFAVWAPNAASVSVIGAWNGWDVGRHPLARRGDSGIWDGFIPGVHRGDVYKYHIVSTLRGYWVDKADPFATYAQVAPMTGSVVWDRAYTWGDSDWMRTRAKNNDLNAPMSIYEVHLGSWRRILEDGNRSLSYRELAPQLAEHVKRLGFTHVEFLPVMEHPFFGSWGYQTTGYFAPSSRFGNPQDFMALVDALHQHGIGVILDWVPSHFPTDEHGLSYFDGTHLFEHADTRQGFHPDWSSYIFNYGRNETVSFLISSAFLWLEKFHADAIRVDAVASMLYLDYSRKEGEWVANRYGGKENLEAIAFLKKFNEAVYAHFPGTQTIAEESTSWPMVSRPIYLGGLGFGLKWDMGWMHDTLEYMKNDPIYRRYHHNKLTFRGLYAYHENFALPLSHDEVVHGKGSLIDKMPGDAWRKFANMRLLFGAMYGQPAKKLIFMGGEFGQWREWNHDGALDWDLLRLEQHAGLMRWVEDLNAFYRDEPAMHKLDFDPAGFEWIDANDSEQSVVSYLRKEPSDGAIVAVVGNFTPVIRANYRVGVPRGGRWREMLNSDADLYGGSGHGNMGGVDAEEIPSHGRAHSVNLTLPPLAIVFLKSDAPAGAASQPAIVAVANTAIVPATAAAIPSEEPSASATRPRQPRRPRR